MQVLRVDDGTPFQRKYLMIRESVVEVTPGDSQPLGGDTGFCRLRTCRLSAQGVGVGDAADPPSIVGRITHFPTSEVSKGCEENIFSMLKLSGFPLRLKVVGR